MCACHSFSDMCTFSLHTHTHTHTERERERERETKNLSVLITISAFHNRVRCVAFLYTIAGNGTITRYMFEAPINFTEPGKEDFNYTVQLNRHIYTILYSYLC